jgi:hypothetical protein
MFRTGWKYLVGSFVSSLIEIGDAPIVAEHDDHDHRAA